MTRGLYMSAAMLAITLALAGPSTQINAQTPPALSVSAAEIGGVVTGPAGPEAGVWVIAETTDLPTKYAKIVVTDDQGRYMIPELPKAKYKVWVRGYGLVDSAEGRRRAGQARQSHGREGAERGRRGRVLPVGLLVRADEVSGEGRVSRHRRQRQPHPDLDALAAPVARQHQDQRLLGLSRARQQGDAHDPGRPRLVRELARSLDPAHPVRPGDEQHDRDHQSLRRAARHLLFRRLDRPHRQW